MKKIITIIMLSLFCAAFQPSYAILAPFNQSVVELRSILSSEELATISTGYPILSIQKNETGYQLETEKEIVQIDLIITPTTRVGPIQFTLKFHTPIEKQ
jgi:hypothetical protein